MKWSYGDSNPKPPACKAGALPVEHNPDMEIVTGYYLCQSSDYQVYFYLLVLAILVALDCRSIGFAVAGLPLFTPVRIVPAVPGAFLPLNLVSPDAET